MVEGVGFEVEGEEVLGSEADGGNEFQWIAARKGRDGGVGSGGVEWSCEILWLMRLEMKS
jgi:hypothetical protein